jgi:hypothetical protein
MASTTLSFQLNSERLDELSKLQKARKRTTLSIDQFAKELVCESLDAEKKVKSA